jgi:hypothetical protein
METEHCLSSRSRTSPSLVTRSRSPHITLPWPRQPALHSFFNLFCLTFVFPIWICSWFEGYGFVHGLRESVLSFWICIISFF